MFEGLLDGYTRSLLIFAGINVIAAYSFYAPFKTGQVSLGQAGFMAVGAYASADPDHEIRHAVCGGADAQAAWFPARSGSWSAFRHFASRASTCCC